MCLNVANYIGKKSPNTAIAPQVVIRKVRVMKNNGDIQGMKTSKLSEQEREIALSKKVQVI